jgi:hypothetical protein
MRVRRRDALNMGDDQISRTIIRVNAHTRASAAERFFPCGGLILRDASLRDAPQDEDLLDPHGEERGSAARLEP